MDRNHSNASRDVLHAEAVARHLREALAKLEPLRPADSGDCLDPEQMAAYRQRTLAEDAAAQCEIHLAACSRCREILTLLASADDASWTERPALDPERIPAADAPQEETPAAKPARPRGFHWRTLWLVPALTATAALAFWFALGPPRYPFARSSAVSVAEAPKPAQALPGEPPPPTAGTLSNSLAGAGRSPSAVPPAAPEGSQEARNFTTATGFTAPAASPPASAQTEPSSAVAAEPEAPAAPPAQAAPPPAAAPEAQAAAQAQPNIRAFSSAAANAPAAAAPPQPAPSALSATGATAPALQPENQALRQEPKPTAAASAPAARNDPIIVLAPNRARDAFFALLKSPSSAVSWRAGAGGRIERSSDGGRTWQLQQSPLREEWLAGSAVSDAVCWLVGRNGAIARTADGKRWQPISSPPMAADASGKSPDWIGITATDAQTAVIRSSGQARYLTRDAGKTWQPQP